MKKKDGLWNFFITQLLFCQLAVLTTTSSYVLASSEREQHSIEWGRISELYDHSIGDLERVKREKEEEVLQLQLNSNATALCASISSLFVALVVTVCDGPSAVADVAMHTGVMVSTLAAGSVVVSASGGFNNALGWCVGLGSVTKKMDSLIKAQGILQYVHSDPPHMYCYFYPVFASFNSSASEIIAKRQAFINTHPIRPPQSSDDTRRFLLQTRAREIHTCFVTQKNIFKILDNSRSDEICPHDQPLNFEELFQYVINKLEFEGENAVALFACDERWENMGTEMWEGLTDKCMVLLKFGLKTPSSSNI
ncbi:MAG: hypothetical protein HQK53_15895 [Oligoflexia bacterium]|nr:hypothetical protein [Oligoflexia bacterium]